MTPQEAKLYYGAEYYSTMMDGFSPELYYRVNVINYNDGTSAPRLEYLSFANIWQGSSRKMNEISELVKIGE